MTHPTDPKSLQPVGAHGLGEAPEATGRALEDLERALDPIRAALRGAEAVLLDLGGVLVPDGWEALVLSDGGIADHFGVDRARAAAAGRSIWDAFADRHRDEADYLAALAAALDLPPIPQALVDAIAERSIVPLPGGRALLEACRMSGAAIGVVTDTAAFVFERQARVLAMEAWLDPELRFTSHQTGLRKKHGLFEHARARTAGRAVLVVDDRPGYVARAAAAGFAALHFEGGPPATSRRGPGRTS